MAHANSQQSILEQAAALAREPQDLAIPDTWAGIDPATVRFVLSTADTCAYRALAHNPNGVAAQRTTLFGVLGDLVMSLDIPNRTVNLRWTPVS